MKRTIFWIPVEDELPDNLVEVLVCDSLDNVNIGCCTDKGWRVLGKSVEIKWWAAKPLPPNQTGTTRLDHKQLVGWVD